MEIIPLCQGELTRPKALRNIIDRQSRFFSFDWSTLSGFFRDEVNINHLDQHQLYGGERLGDPAADYVMKESRRTLKECALTTRDPECSR